LKISHTFACIIIGYINDGLPSLKHQRAPNANEDRFTDEWYQRGQKAVSSQILELRMSGSEHFCSTAKLTNLSNKLLGPGSNKIQKGCM